MTVRIALVVCPNEEHLANVEKKMLGLSVGERLLLALEKAGITHVAFIGKGKRPASSRAGVRIVDVENLPPGVEDFFLLPADLVFDPALLSPAKNLSGNLPIRCMPISGWREVVSDPEQALFELGVGSTHTGPDFAIRITDAVNAGFAECALIRQLYKSADGIVSRHLNRKISTFISRHISQFSITPNQITAVVFLIGVMAGPLAFQGTYAGIALGGFCYWFSAVLDGCDGEISRLKYLSSPLGAWLDTVVDDFVCLSYIIGMYYGLFRNAASPFWLVLGSGAVLFFLLTILPRYYIMATRSGSGDYQKLAKSTRPLKQGLLSRFFLKVRDVVFRTDFLPFAGMVTAVVGYPEVFALPFAFGAGASCIDSFATLVRYKPTAG